MSTYVSDEEMQTLRRYIAGLKSENDGYAGQLTQLSLEVGLLRKKNVELLRTNDRLRELVEDMLDCIEIRAAWHRPPTDEMCEEFAQRARELGVEP